MLKKLFKDKTKKATTEGIQVSLEELIQLQHASSTLKLACNRKVFTEQAGQYKSLILGRGMDFEEIRHYQPGDDIRLMDWRATARSGEAHTKVFQQEKERPVFLVVDFSTSMYFATQGAFKSVIAAKAASLLAWAACRQNDRIGGIIFSDKEHIELRPRNGKQGCLPLLKNLSKMSTQIPQNVQPNDELEHALLRLRRITRPGSLIFVLSDFAKLTEKTQQHLGMLSQHNEVILSKITDPIETNIPTANHYTITDGQQFATINTADKKLRQHYQAYFLQKQQQIAELAMKFSLPLIELTTSGNVLKQLQYYFAIHANRS